MSANTAANDGGGIYNDYGTSTLNNVSVSANTAINDGGGGIYNAIGTSTLTNVTLSSNSGGFHGGGIYNDSGTTNLTNVTLYHNHSICCVSGLTYGGGGIYITGGSVNVKNTLIAQGEGGENCYGSIASKSFSLSDDTTCVFGAGRDNVALWLGPLANNGGPTLTHMPQPVPPPGSPAINGGTGAGCPATDQRGASRVGVGTACDVGSVEYGARLPWLYLPLIRRYGRSACGRLTFRGDFLAMT